MQPYTTHELTDYIVASLLNNPFISPLRREQKRALLTFIHKQSESMKIPLHYNDTDLLLCAQTIQYPPEPEYSSIQLHLQYPERIIGECSNAPRTHLYWTIIPALKRSGIAHLMRDIKEASDGVLLREEAPLRSLYLGLKRRGYEPTSFSEHLWSTKYSELDKYKLRQIETNTEEGLSQNICLTLDIEKALAYHQRHK